MANSEESIFEIRDNQGMKAPPHEMEVRSFEDIWNKVRAFHKAGYIQIRRGYRLDQITLEGATTHLISEAAEFQEQCIAPEFAKLDKPGHTVSRSEKRLEEDADVGLMWTHCSQLADFSLKDLLAMMDQKLCLSFRPRLPGE